MKSFLFFLLTAAICSAATLNVPSQYATVQLAVTAAQPGDTVLIAAGTYNEVVTTARSGNSGARIIIDGQGVATVAKFVLNHSYHTIKNLTISSSRTQFDNVFHMTGPADYNIIQDCVVDAQNAFKVNAFTMANSTTPENNPSYNVIERCVIKNIRAYTAINVAGVENVIRNNVVRDLVQSDYMRLFGINNHIHNNQFLNNVAEEGLANHPDFVQTFGNNGESSYGHLIENNLVNGVGGGQVFQLSPTGSANIRDWTVRNNIFANCSLGGGGSMPGMKIYHNVFYRVGSGLSFGYRAFGYRRGLTSAHPLYSATTQITPSGQLVAEGDGGQFQYGGTYLVQSFEVLPGQDALEAGRTYRVRTRGTGFITYNGTTYTNAQTFVAQPGVTTWTEEATNPADLDSVLLYPHGTFTYNGTTYISGQYFVTDPAVRTWTSTWPEQFGPWRVVVDYANRTEVKNNIFLECGNGSANSGWYGFDPFCKEIVADYNYVAGVGFAAKTQDAQQRPIGNPGGWDAFAWYEPNGINGGDPKFTDIAILDFRLQSNSPLINEGLAITGITTDYAGTARPLGAAPDIGPYEFDDGSPPPPPPDPETPPTAPTNLQSITIGSHSIALIWDDTSNDETGFEIERSADGSTWSGLASVGVNRTSYTDTDLEPSTTLYYRVRSLKIGLASSWSNSTSSTTAAPTDTEGRIGTANADRINVGAPQE